jgi:hypothetical protein
MAGGYAQVLQDGSCGICAYSSGDQYLRQLNMSASRFLSFPSCAPSPLVAASLAITPFFSTSYLYSPFPPVLCREPNN